MTDIQPPAAVGTSMPWEALVGSGARWVMTFVGSWLLNKGITDPQSTEALIAGGAGVLMGVAAFAWSMIQKWLAAKALRTALTTPTDAPPPVVAAVTRLAP